MGYIEKDNIIRSYVCISDNTDTGLMQVLGIVNSYDEAQNICMKYMFEDAEDLGDDNARIEHTLWKMMEQETGLIMHYSIISDQIVQPNGHNMIILIYDKDMKSIMEQLKKMSEAKCEPIVTETQTPKTALNFDDIADYKGLVGPVKPNNEYMEYNFRFLSTKIHNGEESVVINADELRWGSPYIIIKDNGRVTYGIAACCNNDDEEIIFITTIDDLNDRNFGKPREITVTAKDLCSCIKIKYLGCLK